MQLSAVRPLPAWCRPAQDGLVTGAPDLSKPPDRNEVRHSFRVDWAKSVAEIGDAQRLRFRVFSIEMGARLQLRGDAREARDIDAFDPFCDHLLVRATSGAQDGEVIATCRVLSPEGARRAGGLYTDTEFDLTALRRTLPDALAHALEMGRVCVDPLWRNGLVVMGLWRELGLRMAEQQLDTLIGCSSVSLVDGDDMAAALWQVLKRTHLVDPACQVQPRKPLTLPLVNDIAPPQVPALIKAYLRCGGKLLGPPAIDADFNTADFPMWMHLSNLPSRYGKRIFGRGACA